MIKHDSTRKHTRQPLLISYRKHGGSWELESSGGGGGIGQHGGVVVAVGEVDVVLLLLLLLLLVRGLARGLGCWDR